MTISDKLLPVHNRLDVSFTHGKGVYLYDNNNKEYLDFGAGIAVNSLGHCHDKIVEALTSQAKKLWHISNLYSGNELNEFAEKMIDNCCSDYIFFCNSGAEAVECAIKIIRRYFFVEKKPEKYRIITFKGAFHGRTLATISAAAKEKYLDGFRPSLDGFDNVEFNNIEAVKNAITKYTAGILIEPIQGEEGIIVPDKKFLQDLRKICDENDLLLAFDEVQCGMGRTGNLHAHKHFDVEPDIIALAKAIGGGFPLGACMAKKEAAKGMTYGTHGTTFGGNPLAMSVGKAILDEMLSEGFLDNVKNMSSILIKKLNEIKNQFPELIDEIRGVGLMIGIKLNDKVNNGELIKKLMNNGLLAVVAGNNVVRFLPPLIIDENHVNEACEKLYESLKNL